MSKFLGNFDCTVVSSNLELQDAALTRIQLAQKEEPLSPVTLIVPHRSSAWFLRRQLVDRLPPGSALANVNVLTGLEFINACAIACGLSPIEGGDRTARAAKVESSLLQAGGQLGLSAKHPETALRIGALLDELRWCPLDAESLKELEYSAPPTARQSIELIASIRSKFLTIDNDMDASALSHQIVKRVGALGANLPGITALGSVVVLAQSIPTPVWVVLTEIGIPIHRIRIEAPNEPIFLDISGCPDPGSEVEIAVRHVGEAIDSGIASDRVAIIYSIAKPYAGLLEHSLNEAGIFWNGSTERTLRESPLARQVDTLLHMANDLLQGRGIQRVFLMRWLALLPAGSAKSNAHPSKYRNLIRSEGLYGDACSWSNALNALHEQAIINAQHESDEDHDTEDQSTLKFHGHAIQLLELIAELRQVLESINAAESWGEIGIALSLAISRYSPAAKSFKSPIDYTTLEAIETLLTSSLPMLDSQIAVEGTQYLSPSADALRALIDRELERRKSFHGDSAVGVFVGSVASTQGLTFDRVIFVGAADGLLPSVRNNNPLLTDVIRRTLRKSPADAPTVTELEETVKQDVLALTHSAKSVTVLFPRGAVPSSGIAQPSRYFSRKSSDTGLDYQSHNHALRAGPRPITDRDISMRMHMAQADPDAAYSRSILACNAWANPASNPFFGDFENPTWGQYWELQGRTFSASKIETYLYCPYQFFVQNLLGFTTDTFEDTINDIKPNDLGKIIHATLEDLVSHAHQEGWSPKPGDPWPDFTEDRLRDFFSIRARQAQANGITGWIHTWEESKNVVMNSFADFLKVDSEIRRNPPMSPGRTEIKFGFKDQLPVAFEITPEITVFLRGAIDRFDLSPDSQHVRVIDYKSGNSDKFKELKNRPQATKWTKIQDLVYSVAAKSLEPTAQQVFVSFLFVPNKGDVKQIEVPQDYDPEAQLRSILHQMQSSTTEGRFMPMSTGPGDYCPVCSALDMPATPVTDGSQETSND